MKRIIVLPLDGYANGQALLDGLKKMLSIKGVSEIVAYIKLNDGVHNSDIGGPALIEKIQRGLGKGNYNLPISIFLDLKIFDVSATVVNVLTKYLNILPGILTVSSGCSVDGIIKLRKLLPNTKLAMVSVPTDISEDECIARFGMTPKEKIYYDLHGVRSVYTERIKGEDIDPEPFDLIVCSYHEISFLDEAIPEYYGFIIPGIRDEWMKKKDEHQKRTTGVRAAIETCGTRPVYLVMGAQLVKGNPELGITPEESCQRTIEEMEKAEV